MITKEIKIHLEYPLEEVNPQIVTGYPNPHNPEYKKIEENVIRKDLITSILNQLGYEIEITELRDVCYTGFDKFHTIIRLKTTNKQEKDL